MAAPGAGFESPPQEVTWLKRDCLLFAYSIGCKADELNFLYEFHPNFQVFPTYPIILPFKRTSPEIVDFYAQESSIPIPNVPKFDYRRVVDGQRKIEFFHPIPTSSEGRTFEIRTKVLGVYDKGDAGSVVERQTDLVEKDTGKVYTRMTGSMVFRGQGNWGGPKGPRTVTYASPKGVKPDMVDEMQLSDEAAMVYRLNGDYNPLHVDAATGQKMGFEGPIIHGLYSWNIAAHALLRGLGGSDPRFMHSFQARFSAPVNPGEKLVTEAWRTSGANPEGFEEIRFVTKAVPKTGGEGRVVLSNGRARMRVKENLAGASKL